MKHLFGYIVCFSIVIICLFSSKELPTQITMLATFATLAVAYLTYKIAVKSYTQIERESPWKLTPVKDDDFWLLERVHPNVATIYGYCIVEYQPNTIVYNVDKELQFYDDGEKPLRWFIRGTNMIVKIPDIEIGSTVYFLYQEHKNPTQAIDNGIYERRVDLAYVQQLVNIQGLGWGIKSLNWKVFIYRYFPWFCKIKLNGTKRRMTADEITKEVDMLQFGRKFKVWGTSLY